MNWREEQSLSNVVLLRCFRNKNKKKWITIVCARGRIARQCHQGLQEACVESALPYQTVARWVKAFEKGRQNMADIRRLSSSSVGEDAHALTTLLDSN